MFVPLSTRRDVLFYGLLKFVNLTFEFVTAIVFCLDDVKELRDPWSCFGFLFLQRIRTGNPEII